MVSPKIRAASGRASLGAGGGVAASAEDSGSGTVVLLGLSSMTVVVQRDGIGRSEVLD